MKKILCILLTLSMLFVGVIVSADSLYTDVDSSASYAEAVETLNALDIMIGDDEGNFNPDSAITRAETAAIVTRMKNLDNAISAANGIKFSDVTSEHWAAGYINLAEQSGIINGYGDGTFGPEDKVTYEQAIKMIVAALGRSPQASANGGYPSGYLIVAAQEDITKGVNVKSDLAATRKDVACLVFNALEVNVMEQTSFISGKEEYSVVDKTLLKDYLKVEKYEGVITDTYLASGKDVKDDFIKIATETFKEGRSNASSLLGYNVVAYAKENDENDLVLLRAIKKANKNNFITIDYSQIEKDSSINVIKYFAKANDTKTTEIEIDEHASYYFNGRPDVNNEIIKFIEAITQENITFGALTAIDNNNDEKYDVIMLMQDTNNFIVGEVNDKTHNILTKDGNNINIDIDDENTFVKFYFADGTPATFEDITTDNVLTIFENNSLQTVYISNIKITGKVTEEIPYDNKDNAYIIDNKAYHIAYDYGSSDFVTNLSVGSEGVFYINAMGKIVGKDAVSAGSTYAYLYKALSTTNIDGTTIELKYLTTDGVWKTNALANKVTVIKNGEATTVTVKDAAENAFAPFIIYDGTNFVEGSGEKIFQFELNNAGNINRLYILGDTPAKNDQNILSIDRVVENRVYDAKQKKLGSLFLTTDVKVFNVANDVKSEDDIIASTSYMTFSDGALYEKVVAYDIVNEIPSVMISYGSNVDIASDTNLFVITKISEATNENGVKIQKYYGYQKGQEVEGIASDNCVIVNKEDVEISTIKPGDITVFSLDVNNKINKIKVLFTAEEAKTIISANEGAFVEEDNDSYTTSMFGFITKKTNGRIYFNKAFGGDALINLEGDEASISAAGTKTNVYEMNVDRKNIFCSVSDFSNVIAENRRGKDAHWAFVRISDDVVIDVVLYKTVNP